MNDQPREASTFHTRLTKAGLAVEECRAYWERRRTQSAPNAHTAYNEYWFGAKSLLWLQRLMADMRERFEAFPESLQVLASWNRMPSSVRNTICHWHLQLADPLYRAFTGLYLPRRHRDGFESTSGEIVSQWIEEVCPDRWQVATRKQFARKLLYAATDAGLLKAGNAEWQFRTPAVDEVALHYLMYVLRGITFEGTLTANPYVKSVGLDEVDLARRLHAAAPVSIHRQGDLIDFTWRFDSLTDWAANSVASSHREGEVA